MSRYCFSVMLALAAVLICPWSVALAQSQQQHDWCYAESATDAQTIEGCTALVEHAGLSGRALAIVLYDRGLSYENTKQYALALEDFSQAVALDPTYAAAYDDRGNTLARMNEYQQAVADYDKSIALKPTALYYSNRGFVHYKLGNLDQALEDLNESLRLNPNVGRTLVNRALVYLAKHDCPSALQDFLAAKSVNWVADTEVASARSQCGAMMDGFSATSIPASGH